ncbi:MAG TPA: 6-hydroxycyclohex-1-ene-1-carbonyl-CoA dehydrogenase [Candidatus Polarisedimenticolaceae bacterium]|nr:6-hydroxycyclohex-1-ene-1-carbonyl-CoA dehydrogenase [Candidatus Polarisedimenticolaceae bacterium]
MRITGWMAEKQGGPMVLSTYEAHPAADEVVVRVAGCGVCHTDLGFYFDGVPTRHPFPLVLGHEIAGTVVEAGEGADAWLGREVVVPAVIPCGTCPACRGGRGQVCARQIFPGNDVHGGFASHVRVPAQGLCGVPARNGHDLAALSVIADAVSTPYAAVLRSGLGKGELAVFVGAGGVGAFGIQIAAARGAAVIAIEPDPGRRALVLAHGAALALDPVALDFKAVKQAVAAFARERGIPGFRTRIFETSGTRRGQETAFGLLGQGGYLSVVGFTPEKLELRLSNLMAYDATVQGNWGCLPEHYPAVVDLVLSGKVVLEPFLERRPLAEIESVFHDLHARRISRRVVLLPEA